MPARSLAALSLIPIALSAQTDPDEWLERCRRNDWDGDRLKHCEVRETGMRPTREALVVDPGHNGGVAIKGWDADSVAVFAKIQAWGRSEDEARELARSIRIIAQAGGVRAEGPDAVTRRQGWAVSFEVHVPHRTDLDLETENGPLTVRDVQGRMTLAARNGPVTLGGVGGNVRARVQNGPLHVELTGARWEGEGLDAETVNGPATVAIPESYSAELETGTVNGPMRTEFPLTVTLHGHVARRVTAKLGSGGPSVRVVTTNGPMTIRRASRN